MARAQGTADVVQAFVVASQRRSTAVIAAKFEWIERRVQLEPTDPPSAAKAQQFAMKKLLVFDGDRIRYDFEGEWPQSDGGKGENQLASAYDGQRSIQLSLPSAAVSYPSILISPRARTCALTVIHTRPILRTFRTLDPAMGGVRESDLVARPERVSFNGSDCYMIDVKGARPRIRETMWVDPSKDWCIRRWVTSVGTMVLGQIDTDLRTDLKCGWVPFEWRYSVTSGDGTLAESFVSTVTKYEINPELESDAFKIEIPLGAHVTDTTFEPPRDYVVQRVGELRPVLANERTATHDQLLASEPGKALKAWAWKTLVLRGIFILAIAMIAAFVVYRLRAA